MKKKVNDKAPLEIIKDELGHTSLLTDDPERYNIIIDQIGRQKNIDKGTAILFMVILAVAAVFTFLYFTVQWENDELYNQIKEIQSKPVYKDSSLMKMADVESFDGSYFIHYRKDSNGNIISYRKLGAAFDSIKSESDYKTRILNMYRINVKFEYKKDTITFSSSSAYQDTLSHLYNLYSDDIIFKDGYWQSKLDRAIELQIKPLVRKLDSTNKPVSDTN